MSTHTGSTVRFSSNTESYFVRLSVRSPSTRPSFQPNIIPYYNKLDDEWIHVASGSILCGPPRPTRIWYFIHFSWCKLWLKLKFYTFLASIEAQQTRNYVYMMHAFAYLHVLPCLCFDMQMQRPRRVRLLRPTHASIWMLVAICYRLLVSSLNSRNLMAWLHFQQSVNARHKFLCVHHSSSTLDTLWTCCLHGHSYWHSMLVDCFCSERPATLFW